MLIDDPHRLERHRAVSPPPLTVGEALARHWMLIVLITILAAAGGVALGLSRPPVYTSEAELNVGSLDAQAQAIPGYTVAAQTLAEAYARIVSTTKIENHVARDTNLSPGYVSAHLTAANIPDNPIFRIDGTGATPAAARSVAAAATREIIKYARTHTTPPGAAHALDIYKRETATARQLSSRLGKLTARYGASPTPGQQAQLTQLQQSLAAAQLQASANQAVYVNAITNDTSAGTVLLLSPAGTPTSNRTHVAEIGGFAGGVAGFLIGCLLALWLAGRRRRRVIREIMASGRLVESTNRDPARSG